MTVSAEKVGRGFCEMQILYCRQALHVSVSFPRRRESRLFSRVLDSRLRGNDTKLDIYIFGRSKPRSRFTSRTGLAAFGGLLVCRKNLPQVLLNRHVLLKYQSATDHLAKCLTEYPGHLFVRAGFEVRFYACSKPNRCFCLSFFP
ncbi:MAG: hypothetical protein Greene041614_548 [Parcubacteria group bacterium Greene0416_14]|nr:MAG: hypothetical protein Greene041614_548 [Parcubacteria group bacterium Greene0416_14]TSD00562.1 MAG: hypothetical protein Greene101415_783 [Parcubacteria group bacterium Greene1014_15]TSD08255.1 MAG: hypothetical protein Greene07144_237 [Parcubacteria group bacterium Greene0714_4]